MVEKLLREADVLEIISVSRATLWRLIQNGEFPKPGHLGKRSVVWPESVVQRFVDEIKAGMQPVH